MNRQLFANNAQSTLRSGIAADTTTLLLQVGAGAAFPLITEQGDWFLCTLVNPNNGSIEVVKVTAHVGGDALTVQRGQEGTAAQSFPSGSTVDHRITKGTLANFRQQQDAGGIPEAPANGKGHVRKDNDWAEALDPGPARTIEQSMVDAIRATAAAAGVNPGTNNRVAVLSDLAASGSLPAAIAQALAAAADPSSTNAFVTKNDLTGLGGDGGTVLAGAIVDALNAAASPAAGNPFATMASVPASAVGLADVRLTVGALRTLKDGNYIFANNSTAHPILGTIPYADVNTVLGTEIQMPVAVGAVLVKQGRSYMLVLLQVDPQTGTFTPTAYIWEDDNTLGTGVNINTLAQPKSIFRSTGQLVQTNLSYFEKLRLRMQATIDDMRVDPAALPASQSNLDLSILYEPYALLEDPAGGVDLFDGTARYIQIAWKGGTPQTGVVPGKELFTVNGGIYGHLLDGLGGPIITVERVLQWRSEGRILQVMRDVGDPNVGNLCVIQVLPLPGVAGGQALTRDARFGLISMAAGNAAQYSFFRDGAASPAGKVAYKDGATVRYPLFEDSDIPSSGFDGKTVDTPASKVAGDSPLLYDADMAGQQIDIDMSAVAAGGTFYVDFNGAADAPPADKSWLTWFWVRNQSGTKAVEMRLIDASSGQVTAPPNAVAYKRSTGVTGAGLKSTPDIGAGALTTQNFIVPQGNDVLVRFVFFLLPRIASGANLPFSTTGLRINGTLVPWTSVDAPLSSIMPVCCVLDYPMADISDPAGQTLAIYPQFVDQDGTVFSNIMSVVGFGFVFSSTGINGLPLDNPEPTFFASGTSFALNISNPSTLARAVYLLARRGNTGDAPLSVQGAEATQVIEGKCGTASNSAEMRFIEAHEVAVVGANAATILSSALAGVATAYSFIIKPLGTNDFDIQGTTRFVGNELLIPVVYDHHKKIIKVAA